MTLLYKIMMFISSYIPLYIIFLVQEFDFDKFFKNEVCYLQQYIKTPIVYIMIILIIISFMAFFILINLNPNDKIKKVCQIENISYETLSYLVTYVIPILNFDKNSINSIIINIILFLIYGMFYIKAEILHINPIFMLFGYKIYKINSNDYIISKFGFDDFKKNTNIDVFKISNNVYFKKA